MHHPSLHTVPAPFWDTPGPLPLQWIGTWSMPSCAGSLHFVGIVASIWSVDHTAAPPFTKRRWTTAGALYLPLFCQVSSVCWVG
jgi:hypothetical protein